MLGEKIGEEQGKVTGRRILPGDDYRYIKMEVTFETQGTILGVQGMNMGTYTVFERVPGQVYGEGQGIFMTADGQDAIWNGHGVGRGSEDGSMSFAASVAYQAGAGQLERLNSILCLVEHQTEAQGGARTVFHELKP
jgi:hypothetical protein